MRWTRIPSHLARFARGLQARSAHNRWALRDLSLRLVPLLAATLVALLIGGSVVWRNAWPICEEDACPSLADIHSYRPAEAAHVYDVHGRLVAHLPGVVRIWMPLDSMPRLLIDGYVAVEDGRFWEHNGVDVIGVARAALANIREGGVVEGASTITMQLARTIWGNGFEGRNRWIRKLGEVRLARQLEQRLFKDEILELYLNEIYLGRGIYGVPAASIHYFGKTPSELTAHEIAMLVAMTKTPARYNPRSRPEMARARRDLVLDIFVREGLLERAEANQAKGAPVETSSDAPIVQGQSYAAAAVLRELRVLLPDPADRGGVRVFTTLDWEAQENTERLVGEHLIEIERDSSYPHAAPGDVIGTSVRPSPFLQAAAVVLDPRSGAIRATVGGRSFRHSEFDRVAQARRQPGSAFKPFVFAAALDRGVLTLADRIELAPVEWEDENGELWSPRDPLAEDSAEISVRAALSRSSNLAAVRVGLATGIANVIRSTEAFGFVSPLAPYPATLLGASGVTPLELTVAFGTLVNGGKRVTPHLIARVESRDGGVIYQAAHSVTPALEASSAFLARRALEGVTAEGTGWRVRREGVRDVVVGKTGTSNDANDLWFVGSTPDVTATVWIGFDHPTPVLDGRATAASVAAPLWGKIVSAYEEQVSAESRWEPAPRGLRLVDLDAQTGLRVTEACPATGEVRREWFLPGTEPEDNCAPRPLPIGVELGPLAGAPPSIARLDSR